MSNTLRIVFMGTPEFAAHCLNTLINEQYQVAGVVTVPDKPAGRGQQLQPSAVKQAALSHALPVLQPEKLKDPLFLEQLRAWQADVFVVVAFRMLPEEVWSMPRYGTFNLHASLLPQYRGAAPINRAIINGETETGVTTFFLNAGMDMGRIIFNEKITIDENDNAGLLHDKLMLSGAQLICKTLDAITGGNLQTAEQPVSGELKTAPKIYKETCHIDWTQSAHNINNLVRGLSPYPAAYGELKAPDHHILSAKLFDVTPEILAHDVRPGTIKSDGKTFLKVACSDGFIYINELQLAGKKRVMVKDFLAGFRRPESYQFF